MQMAVSQVAEVSKISADAAGLRYVSGEGPGIQRRRRGKGFYYIGVDGRRVRDKRTLNRIRSLVIPPAWENVWICPIPNGHIQAVGRDARGRKQYRYHPRYREVRDETKFERMLAFSAVLPKIRQQVERDFALTGLPQRKVIAAIVRLLDTTCVRVGNDEYAKSNKSYGLTTLKNRHVDVRADTIHLHFRGKSKQSHDITLHDRRLANIVKKCQDLPGQELFQYEDETGEHVKVDSSDVNEYLREIAHEDFTAKDFRTWHGTGYMLEQLAALEPAQSETEARHNIVEAVKETATLLGNRPAACKKYYVHPVMFETDAKEMRLAMQAMHRAQAKRPELQPAERAVIRLIEAHTRSRQAKAG